MSTLAEPTSAIELLAKAKIGDRVTFKGERMPYTIQARDKRFIVCTKPFVLQKTVIYTIVDLVENVRGPENLVFGAGFETRGQCEDAIERLNGKGGRHPTEVTYRNRVPVEVIKVRSA